MARHVVKERRFTRKWQVLRDAKPYLAVPKEAMFADLDNEFPGGFLSTVLGENREIEVTEELL